MADKQVVVRVTLTKYVGLISTVLELRRKAREMEEDLDYLLAEADKVEKEAEALKKEYQFSTGGDY